MSDLKDEPPRYWYSDDYFDLIVWTAADRSIAAFQLCYDRNGLERALIWKHPDFFSHMRVESGEDRPGKMKSAPILVSDGEFDSRAVAERFRKESTDIRPELASFVYEKILMFEQH